MRYLLDTHTLIWALIEPDKLSKKAKALINQTNNYVLVSVVSLWEISLKYSTGRLQLNGLTPEDFWQAARQTDFEFMPLEDDVAISYHQLTATYHRDPFDRMLVWQAIQHNCSLISKDDNVHQYVSEGLKVVW